MGRSAGGTAAARWRERIEDWRRSGRSIAEYCRRKQLSQPSFFVWRKRLAAVDAGDAVAGRGPSRKVEGDRGPSRFVELPPPIWPASGGVQLQLPGGAVAILPRDASSELVAAAIRAAIMPVAEGRPC